MKVINTQTGHPIRNLMGTLLCLLKKNYKQLNFSKFHFGIEEQSKKCRNLVLTL